MTVPVVPPADRDPITIALTLAHNAEAATEPSTAEEIEEVVLTYDGLPKALLMALASLFDKQAQRIVVFETAELTPFYSWAVVCSGLSGVQRDVLQRNIREDLHTIGLNPLSVEGIGDSGWILMDYRGFIIHILSPEKREYYRLENLWGDLPKLEPEEAVVTALLEALEEAEDDEESTDA
ncbi:MAG: ribosome silencing factor [bacterium]